MNPKTKKIAIVAAFVVLAAMAVTGVLVFAESGSPSASVTSTGATTTASTTTTTSFLSKVAKNLGIDESKLTAAIATAQEETIDEAVVAGRITQEQAKAMKERLTAEKAVRQVIADGIASGKLSQEQADLVGGRGLAGGMMGERGLAGVPGGSCGGEMGRGMGR